MSIIPLNPIRAIADGEMMSIIFFAILFAIGILVAGPSGKIVADVGVGEHVHVHNLKTKRW